MLGSVMLEVNKKCEHWAVGRICSKDVICLLPVLRQYCVSTARIYYVGMEQPPPESEILKILKQFKQFKYCPKCGAKLDFFDCTENLFKGVQNENQ